ncbi:hypothetical protein ACP70R_021169 [Stipagrostis hirtigluma subsp. patula]
MVTFTARRRDPELVTPARPTPAGELKHLSDIDNQGSLRYYATLVEFFRAGPGGGGNDDDALRERDDPVAAIRSAIAEALVCFYPVAGRLRELPPDGRLVVECTAEGVAFVAADADVSLAELGEPLRPPYPCVEELLCDLGDTRVTRFSCGGFAVGVHWCHVMSDGFGICKFLQAVGDLARGMAQPTVLPVWEREILTSRAPPRVARPHLAYEPLGDATDGDDPMLAAPPGDMVGRYFFFGRAEVSAIRSSVVAPADELARSATVFELLAAAAWRCRTAALGYAPGRRVRVMFPSNARRGGWKRDPPIPRGYYGNAFVFQVAEATAGELCCGGSGGLRRALELVRGAKREVSDDHLGSTAHLLARRRWPPVVVDCTYVVSDITTIGEDGVDFGWGRRVGGGIPMAGDIMGTLLSYFMRCKDAAGEDCTVVPMYLPRAAMDRFAAQISAICSDPQ